MTQKTYQILLNLLLLSVVIYLGVDVFYRVVGGYMNQYGTLGPLQEIGSAGVKVEHPDKVSLSDFKVITTRNLFGSIDNPSEKAGKELKDADIEALEPTSLNVTLLGTVTDLNGRGWAVIEEGGKRDQGLYREGDPVQDAFIKNVLRGKVVLREGGKDQILEMEESEVAEGTGVSGSARSASSGDAVTVGRSDITNSLQNINELLTQVRIRPHLKNGKPDGFMLSHISSGSMFSKLGLKRGDIVKRLNGAPINTPEDAFAFYKALESGSALTLDIIRQGREKTINYTIR
ncbi:MAG: type II secretion system protein N [Desulfatiglandaceae bacterium]